MSAWDQDRFKRALDFAARAHGEQRVPGSGFPYVVHVTKVATEVLAAFAVEHVGSRGDERLDGALDVDLAVTCALLHDTMEDADVKWEALRDSFGEAVADGVRALTKDKSLPKQGRMKESLDRIRACGREVWMVKLADRITNLEPPPETWSQDKRRAYLEEAALIRDALGEASAHLARRLEAKMADYRGLLSP